MSDCATAAVKNAPGEMVLSSNDLEKSDSACKLGASGGYASHFAIFHSSSAPRQSIHPPCGRIVTDANTKHVLSSVVCAELCSQLSNLTRRNEGRPASRASKWRARCWHVFANRVGKGSLLRCGAGQAEHRRPC